MLNKEIVRSDNKNALYKFYKQLNIKSVSIKACKFFDQMTYPPTLARNAMKANFPVDRIFS